MDEQKTIQVELFNVAEVGEKTIRFNVLTKEEAGIYGLLCPEKTSIKKEDIENQEMPSRVVDFVKLVNVDERFYQYEIWHSDRYEMKDPILIGREKDPQNPTYTWYDKFYFIARWGKELDNFSVLKKKAMEILKRRITLFYLTAKGQINTFLENPDLFCEEYINNNQISIPTLGR